MRTTDFIQRCTDAGMPLDMALLAAKAFEVEVEIILDVRKAKDRARQAKHRAKKDEASRDITLDGVTNVTSVSEKVSPTPPSKNSPNGEIYTSRTREADFAAFWSAYPSKVGKRAALKAYEHAVSRIGGPDPPGAILAGVARAKLSRKWREGIIPNPATWLNQDRWEDQPAEVVPLRNVHERPDPLQRKRDQLDIAVTGFEVAARNRALERAGGA